MDRLHSDAKFKKEMRAIYDQVKAEKELKECTFVPNKARKKNIPRHNLTRDPSGSAIGKSAQLAVSLVRKGTETELGTVKDMAPDSARKAGGKTTGRNSHSKQVLEDVMELQDGSACLNDDDRVLEAQNTLSRESANSKGNKKAVNGELFDYLAYNGVKTQKAMELQKLKNRKELENCTFRPQIIKYQRTYENNKNVYENLLQQQKDYKLYE